MALICFSFTHRGEPGKLWTDDTIDWAGMSFPLDRAPPELRDTITNDRRYHDPAYRQPPAERSKLNGQEMIVAIVLAIGLLTMIWRGLSSMAWGA
jgi:hypothetical protein